MSTYQDLFLEWLRKTLSDFCAAPPAGLFPPTSTAQAWFREPAGTPMCTEAHTWITDLYNAEIYVPVAAPIGALTAGSNAQAYYDSVSTAIATLLLSNPPVGSADEIVVNCFKSSPPSPIKAGPPVAVPRPIRDWVRDHAPCPTGTEVGGGIARFQFVENGDTVIFVANKLIKFEPVGIKQDVAQLLVALDSAARVKGPAGKTLVKQVEQAIIGVVQADLGEGPHMPIIEVVRGHQPVNR